MNDFLTIYVTGGVLSIVFYGILVGTDDAKAEDFGAALTVSLLWPIFVLPFLGVLLGAGLKKLWRKS